MDLSLSTRFAPSPPDIQRSQQIAETFEGTLPSVVVTGRPVEGAGLLRKDGVLEIGAFTLSHEAMVEHLDIFARIAKRVADFFPRESDLVKVLPFGEIAVLPGSLHFPEAFETFKKAQTRALTENEFTSARRRLELLRVGQSVSGEELRTIRGLLMAGAQLATVCAGIDESVFRASLYRAPAQRAKDWLVDCMGSIRVGDARIQARLRSMPFEEFDVISRRVDADLMAQRIEFRGDGSPPVSLVSGAERIAAEMLNAGRLARSVRFSGGGLEGRFSVGRDDGKVLYANAHRVDDVFSALQLGRSASLLLAMVTKDGGDPVRLCKFVDRHVALGLKLCLQGISKHTHVRLADVDEWATRFERTNSQAVSDVERAELGVLLLDAEVCLRAVALLQLITQGDEAKTFWGKLWGPSARDRDVITAQHCANSSPTPLSCDCEGASTTVGQAAMMLGYHQEDRRGAAWSVPENPLVSLTWALNRYDHIPHRVR